MDIIRLHRPHRSLLRQTNRLLLTGLLLLGASSVANAQDIAPHWRALAPGLEYTHIPVKQPFADGKIHAFRVDISQVDMTVELAKNLSAPSLYVKRFVELSNAFVAINGGFFNPDKKPLGLRIKEHEILSPLRDISWWGVFYIANNRPHIVGRHHFHHTRGIKTAIQAGPRLIINSTIPKLRAGEDNRSALCITGARHVLFLITERASMSTTDFAEIIIKPEKLGGYACVDALNLDGGSSSQLYAKVNNFQMYLSNVISVSDAILIQPKKVAQ